MAATGAPAADAPRKKLAANVVRLFKYLAADYFEEFVHSCDRWLQRAFRVVSADQDSPGDRAKAAALATLYGPHVLPENLLRILNNGLRLEHVVLVGVDPGAAAPGLRRELVAELTKHILVYQKFPKSLLRGFSRHR